MQSSLDVWADVHQPVSDKLFHTQSISKIWNLSKRKIRVGQPFNPYSVAIQSWRLKHMCINQYMWPPHQLLTNCKKLSSRGETCNIDTSFEPKVKQNGFESMLELHQLCRVWRVVQKPTNMLRLFLLIFLLVLVLHQVCLCLFQIYIDFDQIEAEPRGGRGGGGRSSGGRSSYSSSSSRSSYSSSRSSYSSRPSSSSSSSRFRCFSVIIAT